MWTFGHNLRTIGGFFIAATAMIVAINAVTPVVSEYLIQGCVGCGSSSSQMCGNGVKEGAEVCDTYDLGSSTCTTMGFTGGSLSCNNDTCTFNTSACTTAQCTSGACCDTNSGNFMAEGTICNAAVGLCDKAETCSGTSAACPMYDEFQSSTFECAAVVLPVPPSPPGPLTADGTHARKCSGTLPSCPASINDAPVIASIPNQTAVAGTAFTMNLSASDANSDAIYFGATGLPAGLALTTLTETTARISGTPAPVTSPILVTVSVSANDGYGAQALRSFDLQLNPQPVSSSSSLNSSSASSSPGVTCPQNECPPRPAGTQCWDGSTAGPTQCVQAVPGQDYCGNGAYNCQSPGCVWRITTCPVPVCGDGKVAKDLEQCDDKNTVPGDGCSASCAIEAGFTCTGAPSTCKAICGDGLIRKSEACDDRNTISGDGCAATCLVEAGFTCTGEASMCTPICGDGKMKGKEQCDNGSHCSGSGRACSTNADCRPSSLSGGSSAAAAGVCAPQDGDGCSVTCMVEQGWKCASITVPAQCSCVSSSNSSAFVSSARSSASSVAAPVCSNSSLSMKSTCQAAYNGNPEVTLCQTFQECASASSAATAPGLSQCTPVCGDGQVMGAEQCDDGNKNDNDICTGECRFPLCSDGVVQGTEQCDDGNKVAKDGCSPSCTVESGWQCLSPANPRSQPLHCDCGSSSSVPRCPGTQQTILTCQVQYDSNSLATTSTCAWARQCLEAKDTPPAIPSYPSISVCSTVCGDGKTVAPELCDDGKTCGDYEHTSCEKDVDCIDNAGKPIGLGRCDPVGGDGCSSVCSCNGDGFLFTFENTRDNNGTVTNAANGVRDMSGGGRDGWFVDLAPGGSVAPLNLSVFGGDCEKDSQCPPSFAAPEGKCDQQSRKCTSGPVCGNNHVEVGEACDDGNQNDADACSSTCRLGLGATCGSSALCTSNNCDSTGKCAACTQDSHCASGTCLPASASPRFCTALCGNGKIDAGEKCDDGNTTGGDSCSASCIPEQRPLPTVMDGVPNTGVAFFNGLNVLKTQVPQLAGSFTECAWVNPSIVDPRLAPVSTGVKGSDAWMNIFLSWDSSVGDALQLALRNLGDGVAAIDLYLSAIGGQVKAGSWFHTCATWNGAVATVYLNGAAVGTSTYLPPRSGAWMELGGPGRFGAGLSGMMDQVAVYDIALTAEEVRSLYVGKPVKRALLTDVCSKLLPPPPNPPQSSASYCASPPTPRTPAACLKGSACLLKSDCPESAEPVGIGCGTVAPGTFHPDETCCPLPVCPSSSSSVSSVSSYPAPAYVACCDMSAHKLKLSSFNSKWAVLVYSRSNISTYDVMSSFTTVKACLQKPNTFMIQWFEAPPAQEDIDKLTPLC